MEETREPDDTEGAESKEGDENKEGQESKEGEESKGRLGSKEGEQSKGRLGSKGSKEGEQSKGGLGSRSLGSRGLGSKEGEGLTETETGKEIKEEGQDEFTPVTYAPSKSLSVKTELSNSRVKSEKSSTKRVISKMLSSMTKVPTDKDNPRNSRNVEMPGFLAKRTPYTHDPPRPEERRPRISNPRTPKEYIINLREDLADFQESHGLPRTRDYSFMSLGLALAQEIVRALYSLGLMLLELLPIVAIISLLMRFALDKLIDIFETPEPVPKMKKTAIFVVEMILVIIPIWILFVVIILPLLTLLLSLLKRTFFHGAKKCGIKPKKKPASCPN